MSALLLIVALMAGFCLVRAVLGVLAWTACLAVSLFWSLLDPQGARLAFDRAAVERG